MAEKAVKKTTKPVVKPAPKAVKASSSEVKAVKKEVNSKVSAPSFDLTGKKQSTVALPEELFNGKINDQLMAQAVRVYLANQRQGNAHTKTRSEVTGSRRKVWRQKGTGRARHGSITGPIFVGGGIVHGPRAHEFNLKMPKKMRIQALVSALTEKNRENQVFVIDGALSGKTKEFANIVKSIVSTGTKKTPSVLFVRSKKDSKAQLASRNVYKVATVTGSTINTYEVIKNSALVLSKDAIDEMKEAFVKLS